MSLTRTIARNVVSNWVGFAVHVAVTFFLTPFVLRTLGETRYGIWSLVMGVTGYYGLLDLGFRAGLTQYLARALATRDYALVNRTASTGLCAMLVSGALVCVVSVLAACLAPLLFVVPAGAAFELRWCIVVVGISAGTQFCFFPYSALFPATQRYDLSNAIGIFTRLLTAGSTVAVLMLGFGLLGLSIATAAVGLVDYLLRFFIAHRILPELRISLRTADWESFRQFTSYGIWNVLIKGAKELIYYSDTLVIAVFMPPAAITPFALAGSLVNYFSSAIRPISSVFFPEATRLDASNDREGLRRLYLKATRLVLLVAVTATAIGIVWATDFYRLWVGPAHSAAGIYPGPALLFCILMGAAVITSGQRIGYQVLLGMRLHRRLAMLFVAEAIVNIILSLVLVQRLGLIGVAVGTLAPAILFQGFVHPVVLCRTLELPWTVYFAKVWSRAGLYAGLLIPVLLAERFLLPAPSTQPALLLAGIVSLPPALLLVTFIGLTRTERQSYVFSPIYKVYQSFGSTRHPAPPVSTDVNPLPESKPGAQHTC